MRKLNIIAAALLSLGILACGGGMMIAPVGELPGIMQVDGSREDWNGRLLVDEDEDVLWGFVSDGDYLYVTLVAKQQEHIQQIAMSGLTVWFDPTGKGKTKTAAAESKQQAAPTPSTVPFRLYTPMNTRPVACHLLRNSPCRLSWKRKALA